MTSATMVKQTFHFKTEKLRNEKNEVIGEGKKHPSVELDLPQPSLEQIAVWIADPATYAKEVELLQSTMLDQVYRIARVQINDFRENNKDATVTAAVLNYDKLDWTAIANMPKAERGSSVPSEADIKAFLDTYLRVMPAALNKPQQNIENHIVCFTTVFKKQRGQKDILEMFVNALQVFVVTLGDAVEEHIEVVEYFGSRLDRLLKTEEKITMDNL
jgi:hypothetical protein